MNSLRVLRWIMICFGAMAFAQAPTDCVNAISVCGNGNFSSNSSGYGNEQEVSGCSSFEHNSFWIKVEIVQTGTLGFNLVPDDDDINVDYDFWVFGPNVNCGNIGNPIRCATTNPNQAGLANNHTGIDGSTTLTQTGPGANGNGYVYWLDVTIGESYFIVVDRPEGDGGFEIEWTGTAMQGDGAFPAPPSVNAIEDVLQCSSTPDIGLFDLNGVAASINVDDTFNSVLFFSSLADATDEINPLPSIYANTSNPQQIFAKVKSALTDCYEIVDFNLVVSPIPDVTATALQTEICLGDMAEFEFTGSPNATISYSINSGTETIITLDGSGYALLGIEATTDLNLEVIDAKMINANGDIICAQSASAVHSVAVKSFDAAFELSASCESAEATILGDVGGTFSFNPQPADMAVINPVTGDISNGTAGATYSVMYLVGDADCEDSSIEQITLLDFADTNFTMLPNCYGATAQINGDTNGMFSFDIPPADSAVIDSVTGTITNGTPSETYSVRYEILGICGTSTVANVTLLPLDDAGFTMTPVCGGATATVSGLPGGVFSFNPDPNDGAVINATTGEVSNGIANTVYTVEYITNGTCPSSAMNSFEVILSPRIYDPVPFVICDDGIADGRTTFDLSTKDSEITGGDTSYIVNYFERLSDAEQNINALVSPYENTSNPQTLHVRVDLSAGSDPNLNACYSLTTLQLEVLENPVFDLYEFYTICTDTNGTEVQDRLQIDTGLSGDEYAFEWYFNGDLILGEDGSILIPSAPGNYMVKVTDLSSLALCFWEASTEVVLSSIADLEVIQLNEMFSDPNVIQATATGPGVYEYNVDNGTWQDSGEFSNLSIGYHLVKARDKYGCGIVERGITVLGYPQFFTPNGDGRNDTWNIPGLSAGDNISIFDRYGKLITKVDPTGSGWDGMYNGRRMATNDFWFFVEFKEPITGTLRQFRAHFTLKR